MAQELTQTPTQMPTQPPPPAPPISLDAQLIALNFRLGAKPL